MSEFEFEGYFWPLGKNKAAKVTSPFGERKDPITGAESFHNGVDLAVPQGSIVYSPCDGKVRNVWEDEKNGGGLSVSISDGRLRFGFCHLSDAFVEAGQKVKKGEPIAHSGGKPGTVGAGRSTGPHLHFTVRRMDTMKRIDPLECVSFDYPKETPIDIVKEGLKDAEETELLWGRILAYVTDYKKQHPESRAAAFLIIEIHRRLENSREWVKEQKEHIEELAGEE